jgi:hypothetical protein
MRMILSFNVTSIIRRLVILVRILTNAPIAVASLLARGACIAEPLAVLGKRTVVAANLAIKVNVHAALAKGVVKVRGRPRLGQMTTIFALVASNV